jgi:hypothetical protein
MEHKLKYSGILKYTVIVFGILASNIFSQSDKKLNEIGWENGLIYVYKGFNSVNVGVKFQPNWSFDENNVSTTSSYPYSYTPPSSGTAYNETKFISVGIQISKEYQSGKYLFVEPYSLAGYLYTASEDQGTDRNTNLIGSYASSQKSNGSGFFMEMGVKPGFIFWNTIKVFTTFGLALNFHHTETESSNEYSTSKSVSDVWTINHFGDQLDYESRLNLSILF